MCVDVLCWMMFAFSHTNDFRVKSFACCDLTAKWKDEKCLEINGILVIFGVVVVAGLPYCLCHFMAHKISSFKTKKKPSSFVY